MKHWLVLILCCILWFGNAQAQTPPPFKPKGVDSAAVADSAKAAAWNDLKGMPACFADSVDDVGAGGIFDDSTSYYVIPTASSRDSLVILINTGFRYVFYDSCLYMGASDSAVQVFCINGDGNPVIGAPNVISRFDSIAVTNFLIVDTMWSSAKYLAILEDTIRMGDTAVDAGKIIWFVTPADSGGIRYDASTNKMQYINPGGSWTDIGSGAASVSDTFTSGLELFNQWLDSPDFDTTNVGSDTDVVVIHAADADTLGHGFYVVQDSILLYGATPDTIAVILSDGTIRYGGKGLTTVDSLLGGRIKWLMADGDTLVFDTGRTWSDGDVLKIKVTANKADTMYWEAEVAVNDSLLGVNEADLLYLGITAQAADVDSTGTEIAAALGTRADWIGGRFTGDLVGNFFSDDSTVADSHYATTYTVDTIIHDTVTILRADTANQLRSNRADTTNHQLFISTNVANNARLSFLDNAAPYEKYLQWDTANEYFYFSDTVVTFAGFRTTQNIQVDGTVDSVDVANLAARYHADSSDFASKDADSIQGRGVASTAPVNGEALVWNGTQWAPEQVDSANISHGVTIHGDLDVKGRINNNGFANRLNLEHMFCYQDDMYRIVGLPLVMVDTSTFGDCSGSFEDSSNLMHPSIIYDAKGINNTGYTRMLVGTPYGVCWGATGTENENPEILYSNNDTTWVDSVYASASWHQISNPIFQPSDFGADHLSDPENYIDEDGYGRVIFRANWTSDSVNLIDCYSTDGYTWTDTQTIIKNTEGLDTRLMSPAVCYIGQMYHMWYVDAPSAAPTRSWVIHDTCSSPRGTWGLKDTAYSLQPYGFSMSPGDTAWGKYVTWHLEVIPRNEELVALIVAKDTLDATEDKLLMAVSYDTGSTWTVHDTVGSDYSLIHADTSGGDSLIVYRSTGYWVNDGGPGYMRLIASSKGQTGYANATYGNQWQLWLTNVYFNSLYDPELVEMEPHGAPSVGPGDSVYLSLRVREGTVNSGYSLYTAIDSCDASGGCYDTIPYSLTMPYTGRVDSFIVTYKSSGTTNGYIDSLWMNGPDRSTGYLAMCDSLFWAGGVSYNSTTIDRQVIVPDSSHEFTKGEVVSLSLETIMTQNSFVKQARVLAGIRRKP